MAQTYAPQIRLTPPAGAVLTYNIASYSYVTGIQPAWEELVTETEMLDRSTQQTRYGWRVTVALSLMFPNAESANEAIWAQNIVTYAVNDEWLVEMTLDGVTWRQVVLSQYAEKRAGDKNIGIEVSMLWTCVDIVTTKPALLGGLW
jgi:hypothetical protein